jgi:hypothetical protein
MKEPGVFVHEALVSQGLSVHSLISANSIGLIEDFRDFGFVWEVNCVQWVPSLLGVTMKKCKPSFD